MAQSNSISDTLTQGSSLVGGLLSQMGGNALQDNLFSNILSQSSDLQASLAAIAKNGNPNGGATATPTSNASSITSQSTTSDANQASSGQSSSGLMRTLSELSRTLHKALAVLRQQQHENATSTAPKTSQTTNQTTDQTTTPNNAPTGLAPSQGSNQSRDSSTTTQALPAQAAPPDASTTPPANTTQTVDAAAPPPAPLDAQSLATIIAQLLLLTQAMMKNLQQAQTAAGNATTGQVGTSASDAAALGAMNDTNSLMSAATGASSAAPTVPTPLLADAAPTPPTSTPPQMGDAGADFTTQLQKMLTNLQKQVQLLLPAQTNAGPNTANTATPPSDLAPTLAALDAGLTAILKNLQQQNADNTTTTAAAASAAAATAATGLMQQSLSQVTEKMGSKTVTAPPPPLPSDAQQADTSQKTTSDTSAKTDLSVPQQSQILPLVNNAPIQPAPPPTYGQSFSLNAAQAAATNPTGGNTSTDSDAGSDLLSGGKNTTSPAPTENNNALNAGGAQAAGTYSFASTLSATRALNGGATGLPSPVDQVIVQINRSVKNGDDQISLQLHPADLGRITVKLEVGSDGMVQGSVTAENPQTLALLQKDSRSLERALQDAGLRTDPGSLQFNLGGQGNNNGNNAGQTANNGNNNANTGNGSGTLSASDLGGLSDLGSTSENYYLTPSGVNIQV